ncbi:MAG: hypothetical protein AAF911_05145 [Planctomycetota bacterium]
MEYKPPNPGHRFSTLNVVILQERDNDVIRQVMESESAEWVQRYPIPLMATAFSRSDDLIVLGETSQSNHLFSWLDEDSGELIQRWEIIPDKLLPAVALHGDKLDDVFSDIAYESQQELVEKAVDRARKAKRFRLILFAWLVVVPVVWALLEWSSEILGLLVLAFVILKAIIQSLRLFGLLPKTQRQLEKENREMKMKHYFYHCEKNPKAFERLKLENFKKEAIEDTLAESRQIELRSPEANA